jgi:hypothetical protein
VTERGSENDIVFGVTVDGDGRAEVAVEQLTDEGNSRRTADEKKRGQLVVGDAGGSQSSTGGGNGFLDGRTDHVLEFTAGEANLAQLAADRNRDNRIDIR